MTIIPIEEIKTGLRGEAIRWTGPSIIEVDQWLSFEDWVNERKGDVDVKYHGRLIYFDDHECASVGDWIVKIENQPIRPQNELDLVTNFRVIKDL